MHLVIGKAALATIAIVGGMKLVAIGTNLEFMLPGLGLFWIGVGFFALFLGYFLRKKNKQNN